MRMYDLITKKKHNEPLTDAEIEYMIDGYVKGDIPDYQMSSMLMAIWFNGMNDHEITELTKIMAKSGDMIDLSAIAGKKVDKHSTGGVGDKTTLIVAPIVAACGGKVAKMSGRGLSAASPSSASPATSRRPTRSSMRCVMSRRRSTAFL